MRAVQRAASLFAHWATRPRRKVKAPDRARHSFRPVLEELPSRVLPAVNWIGLGGAPGNWSVADNWLDDATGQRRIPGPNDEARLEVALDGGVLNSTVNQAFTVRRLVLNNGNMTVTIADGITLTVTEGFEHLVGTIAGAGTLKINPGGVYEWRDGAATAGTTSIEPNATLNIISANVQARSGRTLVNKGTVNYDSAAFGLITGGAIQNDAVGVFVIKTGAVLNDRANPGQAKGTFTNAGLLRKPAEAQAGVSTIQVPFTNSGTIDLVAGTLKFTLDVTQTAGATNLIGGSFETTGKFTISGGSLYGAGSVSATEVVNGGSLSMSGASAIITINGAYTQTATGSMTLRVRGVTAGTDFDQLRVTGAAKFAGTLNTSFINFNPAATDTFDLITFGSTDGSKFTTENLPNGWEALYQGTKITLRKKPGGEEEGGGGVQ